VNVAEDGLVGDDCLLARVHEHFAHMLCICVSHEHYEAWRYIPQPEAICAIWLLGMILPLAFLTTFGDASDAALGATAIESMMSLMPLCV
jgi:hypothetical protein